MAKLPRLDPAASVIDILGMGTISEITGIDRTQCWRWTQPKSKKGTGGFIPQDHHDPILAFAEQKGLPITAAMLVRRSSKSRSRRAKRSSPVIGERSDV